MTFRLGFKASAQKEWDKLDAPLRAQFKKKLEERLEMPRVPSARLHGSKDRYKIKLRSAGCRLIYEGVDERLVVVVIAIGKRNRNEVYRIAETRHR